MSKGNVQHDLEILQLYVIDNLHMLIIVINELDNRWIPLIIFNLKSISFSKEDNVAIGQRIGIRGEDFFPFCNSSLAFSAALYNNNLIRQVLPLEILIFFFVCCEGRIPCCSSQYYKFLISYIN